MDRPATEAANPASAAIDTLDALGIVRLLNSEDAAVPSAVARAERSIAAVVDLVAARLRSGGRLVYAGAGTSGRLGMLDAAECPPTFDTPPGLVTGLIAGGETALVRAVEGAEDRADLAVADVGRLAVGPADVVVGIAACGRTPWVLAALAEARRRGAATVALACTAGSAIAAAADIAIEVPVGPEVITGSTRLKAGTATKLVLNTITTGAMVLLGKTHGNLMVDLRATNAKLRDRAERIVSALTGLSAAEAADLLAAHDGEVKTAVVAFARGVDTRGARALLAGAGGRLRDALDGASASARGGSRGGSAGETLLAGIDGGGSGCRAAIAVIEEGIPRIVGRGAAGPANPRLAGVDRAASNVRAALADAFAESGLEPRRVDVAVAGLAGAGRAALRLAMEASLAGMASALRVVTDAELVLGESPSAVALLAGTGSIAVCRAGDGALARAGGWGPLVGDEGSGHWIAVEALAAAARMADGRGPATELLPILLERLGCREPRELVERVHDPGMTREKLSALAIDVGRAAAAGDRAAGEILARAAAALVESVAALRRRHLAGGSPWTLRLAGGLLLGCPSLRRRVEDGLTAGGMTPAAVEPVADPATEAVSLAWRIARAGGIPGETGP